MRLQIFHHKKLTFSLTPKRCCSQDNLLLGEARQRWMNSSLSQMCKALGRRPYAFDNPGRTNAVGDVVAKTCRIVFTDQYIPASQLILSHAPTLTSINAADVSKSTWKTCRQNYVEPINHSPVDISWQTMKDNLNNLVTVGDVVALLSSDDAQMYGSELLRIHLLTQHNTSYQNVLYFSMEDFFEQSVDTKQWLGSIRSIADYICSEHQSMAADSASRDRKLLSALRRYKRELLQMMDYMWYLGTATVRHKQLTGIAQDLILSGECSLQTSIRVLEEMSIILNIISPTTAENVWDKLHSNRQLFGEDVAEELNEQKWPETNMSTKTSWPIFIEVLDSTSKLLAIYRSPKSKALPQVLTQQHLVDLFRKKTLRVDENLGISIEKVDWSLDTEQCVVNASITVNASDDIIKQMTRVG